MAAFTLEPHVTLRRFFAVCVPLGIFPFFIGCTDAPRATLDTIASSTQETGLVGLGTRDSYDWDITEKGFEVTRDTKVQFLKEFSHGIELDNVVPSLTNAKPWTKPGWIDDSSHRSLLRFVQPPLFVEAVKIPASSGITHLAFDITSDGKILYALLGQSIVAYDVRKGTEVSKKPNPLPDAYGILASYDLTSLLICNDKQIARVSFVDGSIKAKIDLPNSVSNWVKASENDSIGIITSDNRLLFIDSDLKRFQIANGFTMTSNRLSIHPKAERLLAFSEQGPVRWNLRTPPNELEVVATGDFDKKTAICVSGYSSEVWADATRFHQYQGDRLIETRSNTPLYDAASFDLFEVRDNVLPTAWIGMGHLISETTPWETVIYDSQIGQHQSTQSFPHRIGKRTGLIRTKMNQNGRTVALLDSQGLTVIQRNFTDISGRITFAHIIRQMSEKGDFQSLDKIGELIRDIDWPQRGRSGEEVFTTFVEEVGNYWKSLEQARPQNESTRKMLAHLDAWYQTDSVLAVASSAKRHQLLALESRGTVPQAQLSRKNLQTIDDRHSKTQADIDRLLKLKHPPAVTFQIAMNRVLQLKTPVDQVEEIVHQCTRLYPNYREIHRLMLSAIVNDSNSQPGDAHAYLNALVDLYPVAMRDEIYARIAIEFLGNQDSELPAEADSLFRYRRILRSAESLMNSPAFDASSTETLIEIAHAFKDSSAESELIDFHLSHFPKTSPRGRTRIVHTLIEQRKQSLMKQVSKLY